MHVVHSAFVQRLKDALAVRNAHCHFVPADEPDEVLRRLRKLQRAADELRLPCAGEIKEMIARIVELQAGTVPVEPTVAETVQMARAHADLEARRARGEVALTEAVENLDQAHEREQELMGLLGTAGAADVTVEALRVELRDARSHVERLQQEADIGAAHQRAMEEQRQSIEASQALAAAVPMRVVEVLGHLYALAFASLHLQEQLIARAADATSRSSEEVLADVTDDGRLASQTFVDLVADLGAPKGHVDGLPAEPLEIVRWMLDHARTIEALTAAAAWQFAVSMLDEESRHEVEALVVAGMQIAHAITAQVSAHEHLLAGGEHQLADPLAQPREVQEGNSIRPGELWPFPKGDDAWVLSALRREIRRPGRRSGRLRDQLGDAGESAVVDAFLKLRPEGGRVFIDGDGDASTYVDGELIYLGLLSQLASPS